MKQEEPRMWIQRWGGKKFTWDDRPSMSLQGPQLDQRGPPLIPSCFCWRPRNLLLKQPWVETQNKNITEITDMLEEKVAGSEAFLSVLSGAECVHTERKTCETSPGGPPVRPDGPSREVKRKVGRQSEREYSGCPTAQSCALSRARRAWGVGLWWMGTRGQTVVDGHSPQAPTPPQVQESCRGWRPPSQEGI